MAWTENIYVNPWLQGEPIDLGAVARRIRDYLLNTQTLWQETIAKCLSDTRDEVLSNENWLENGWCKEDWSD